MRNTQYAIRYILTLLSDSGIILLSGESGGIWKRPAELGEWQNVQDIHVNRPAGAGDRMGGVLAVDAQGY